MRRGRAEKGGERMGKEGKDRAGGNEGEKKREEGRGRERGGKEEEAVVGGRGKSYERVMSYMRAFGRGTWILKIHSLRCECNPHFASYHQEIYPA